MPDEAAGRWPFRPVQFPNAPMLGGPAGPTPAGSFGTAPRFGQGGIYTEDSKAKVPPEAKVLIQQLVVKLRATSEQEASHRRVGKPVFGCADAKGVFSAMDTDDSGELDSEEFEEALRKLGLFMSKAEVAELMRAMDEDGSGTIDEQEFFAVVQIATDAEADVMDKAVEKKRKGEDTNEAVFEASEAKMKAPGPNESNLSGAAGGREPPPVPIVWVAEERSRSTPHGGLPFGCEEIPKHHTFPQALRFGLGDGSEVSGHEASKASGLIRRFVSILGTKRNVGDLTQDRAGEGRYQINPRAVFDSLDDDGSGELDADEFETALSVLGCGFSRPMVRQLMAALDKDGGGTIDFPEFEALFVEYKAAIK